LSRSASGLRSPINVVGNLDCSHAVRSVRIGSLRC
jgi:hypothetical protein